MTGTPGCLLLSAPGRLRQQRAGRAAADAEARLAQPSAGFQSKCSWAFPATHGHRLRDPFLGSRDAAAPAATLDRALQALSGVGTQGLQPARKGGGGAAEGCEAGRYSRRARGSDDLNPLQSLPRLGLGCVRSAELEGSAGAVPAALGLGHLPGDAGVGVLDLLVCRTRVAELVAGVGVVEVPPDTRHVCRDLEVAVLFGCNLDDVQLG